MRLLGNSMMLSVIFQSIGFLFVWKCEAYTGTHIAFLVCKGVTCHPFKNWEVLHHPFLYLVLLCNFFDNALGPSSELYI